MNDKQFLKEMENIGSTGIVTTIPFLNDDVPKYLENLERFREESEMVNIEIT